MNPLANNLMSMLQAFNQFRQQMVGQDPKAIVQQLINEGKMTQEQLEDLKRQAAQMRGMLGVR